MNELNKYWNDLNGDNIIDSFESNWTKWNVNDSLKWFKFVLSTKYTLSINNMHMNNNNNDNDYVIENLSEDDSDTDSDSESDSENDDEKLKESNVKETNVRVAIDYSVVEEQLNKLQFRAKKNLPLIKKSFQYHQFGFENKNDRKLLCQATKELMEKYPKKSKKKSQNNKNKQNDNLEGFVDDTQK